MKANKFDATFGFDYVYAGRVQFSDAVNKNSRSRALAAANRGWPQSRGFGPSRRAVDWEFPERLVPLHTQKRRAGRRFRKMRRAALANPAWISAMSRALHEAAERLKAAMNRMAASLNSALAAPDESEAR